MVSPSCLVSIGPLRHRGFGVMAGATEPGRAEMCGAGIELAVGVSATRVREWRVLPLCIFVEFLTIVCDSARCVEQLLIATGPR